MTYRSETRVFEDALRDTARILAPATAEDLPVTAQECADEHLFAELQGRWRSRQVQAMPYRVEVRVWEGEAEGGPAASAVWEAEHGVMHPGTI